MRALSKGGMSISDRTSSDKTRAEHVVQSNADFVNGLCVFHYNANGVVHFNHNFTPCLWCLSRIIYANSPEVFEIFSLFFSYSMSIFVRHTMLKTTIFLIGKIVIERIRQQIPHEEFDYLALLGLFEMLCPSA